ncbi:hypothetical protein OsI_03075 [Oryza sativa Indica Group]|uniref:Uncharacterized protein n=1 Tax=Oryza sativa subsp. indica TaxID=39946 RepID=A2WT89_ORYSI|nr:hypothetical protein OsI_03075 [Oryza sativa Indica Group]
MDGPGATASAVGQITASWWNWPDLLHSEGLGGRAASEHRDSGVVEATMWVCGRVSMGFPSQDRTSAGVGGGKGRASAVDAVVVLTGAQQCWKTRRASMALGKTMAPSSAGAAVECGGGGGWGRPRLQPQSMGKTTAPAAGDDLGGQRWSARWRRWRRKGLSSAPAAEERQMGKK